MRILHVSKLDKFIPAFIDLVHDEFGVDNHFWWLEGNFEKFPVKNSPHIFRAQPLSKTSPTTYIQKIKFIIELHRADKIILHGLFTMQHVFFLWAMPWLLRKCYWVMWGSDLYLYKLGAKDWRWKRNEFFRRPVIKNIGHLVTYIKGDVELARQWYGAKGEYVECLMYPSNLYKEYELSSKKDSRLTILLGNSADPTNNHSEVLQELAQFKDKDIKVITPLSYGDQNYAQQIAQEGERLLGDKYQALTEFMPFDEYLKILAEVDVAIFNHRRQQAMGNTITLLGLGKKVYMRSDTTQWQFFGELGVEVADINCLEDTLFVNEFASSVPNKEKIKTYFSKKNVLKQLGHIFNG